jgi:hypothetical protein
MAATLAKLKGRGDVQMGARVEGAIVDFTGDASYPAGGYAVTPAQFGLKRIVAIVDLGPQTAGATGRLAEYDPVNAKVKLLLVNAPASTATPLAEVTAATNVTTVTRRLLALGN